MGVILLGVGSVSVAGKEFVGGGKEKFSFDGVCW